MTYRKSRRERRYESVLNVVKYQTGGPTVPNPLPPTMRKGSIKLHMVSHGQYERRPVELSIRAAIENGDLIEFDVDGESQVALAEVGALRQVIGYENSKDDPDMDVIERASAAINSLDD